MHYAIFRGTAAQVFASTNQFDVTQSVPETDVFDTTYSKNDINNVALTGTALHRYGATGALVEKGTFSGATQTITLSKLEQIIPANDSVDYTVVFWIEETGTAQESDEGKNFSADIYFNTTNGGSVKGVTAVLG